ERPLPLLGCLPVGEKEPMGQVVLLVKRDYPSNSSSCLRDGVRNRSVRIFPEHFASFQLDLAPTKESLALSNGQAAPCAKPVHTQIPKFGHRSVRTSSAGFVSPCCSLLI